MVLGRFISRKPRVTEWDPGLGPNEDPDLTTGQECSFIPPGKGCKTGVVKWVVWIAVVICLGTAGWFGWDYWQKTHQKPPEYRTAQVTRGDVTQAVSAT